MPVTRVPGRIRLSTMAFLKNALRVFVYRFFFGHIGTDTTIPLRCELHDSKKISIGNHTFINRGCRLDGRGGIDIGNFVLIGPGCNIMSSGHRFDQLLVPIIRQGIITKRAVIQDGAWLGAGTIVLPGIVIGKGAVVGAGSVVTKNVKPFAVVVGNPARFVKWRNGVTHARGWS